MSEPPHQMPVDWDYWLNTDLMDACYDPMHDGMGLDSLPSHITLPRERIDAISQPHGYPERGISDGAYYSGLGDTESAEPSEVDPWLETTMVATETSVTLQGISQHSDKGELYKCSTCSKDCYSYGDSYEINYHLRTSGHTLACAVSGCDQRFVSWEERKAHEQRPHTAGHGRLATNTLFDCAQCKTPLQSKSNLLRHAKEQQHQPFACECGAFFSRLDVLNRHLEKFGTDEPQYPCQYCRRHRGVDGFRRKDHLMQHIRNYHHHEVDIKDDADSATGSNSRLKYSFPVCSHPECPQYRTEAFKKLPRSVQDQDKPFASQSAYTKHMREEHNECAFPCDIPGCDRVGRRGYFREKDLIKHRNEQHPDAPDYRVSVRELCHRCTEPGCGAMLDFSSLSWHYEVHAWRKRRVEELDASSVSKSLIFPAEESRAATSSNF